MDIRRAVGAKAGIAREKLDDLLRYRQSNRFTARERAALEYAERMTITGEKVTEELWTRLRSHFSESQMVELTAAVALENFRSKFNVPLGVEAQGFCMIR